MTCTETDAPPCSCCATSGSSAFSQSGYAQDGRFETDMGMDNTGSRETGRRSHSCKAGTLDYFKQWLSGKWIADCNRGFGRSRGVTMYKLALTPDRMTSPDSRRAASALST